MWGSDSEKLAFGRIWPLWYGEGSVRNRRRAVQKLTELADEGYAPAAFAVGLAYFDGDGVRRDYAAAYGYYRKAAELEYPPAEGEVGNFHITANPKHRACEYDPREALRWHRRAAEHGNPAAQYNLAFSYWDGRGTQRSVAETYVWSCLSVKCSPLRNRPAEALRDQAVPLLSPEEKSLADERVTQLSAGLPHPWSEHLRYWRILGERAGAIDSAGDKGTHPA